MSVIMMMLAGFSLTSCEEDEDVERSIDLSGAWTGDMGMYVEVDYRGHGSVIYDPTFKVCYTWRGIPDRLLRPSLPIPLHLL